MNTKTLLFTLITTSFAPSKLLTLPIDCQSNIAQFTATSDLPNLELALHAGRPDHLQRSYIIIGLMNALMKPKPFKGGNRKETLDHFKKVLFEDQMFDTELFGNVMSRYLRFKPLKVRFKPLKLLEEAKEFKNYPDFLKLFYKKIHKYINSKCIKACISGQINLLDGHIESAKLNLELAYKTKTDASAADQRNIKYQEDSQILKLWAALTDPDSLLEYLEKEKKLAIEMEVRPDKLESLSNLIIMANESNQLTFRDRTMNELLLEYRLQYTNFTQEFYSGDAKFTVRLSVIAPLNPEEEPELNPWNILRKYHQCMDYSHIPHEKSEEIYDLFTLAYKSLRDDQEHILELISKHGSGLQYGLIFVNENSRQPMLFGRRPNSESKNYHSTFLPLCKAFDATGQKQASACAMRMALKYSESSLEEAYRMNMTIQDLKDSLVYSIERDSQGTRVFNRPFYDSKYKN